MNNQRKLIFQGLAATRANADNLTCLQLSESTVIDAGYLPEPKDHTIENIFISHVHLDHICALAWYVDNYFSRIEKSINIYGSAESIAALREHFFNDKIWPDFSKIRLKSGEFCVRFTPICEQDRIQIEDLIIEPFSSKHSLGSFSYIIHHESGSVFFSSDTAYDERIAECINSREEIKQIIADVSFADEYEALAHTSMHMTPSLYARLKEKFTRDVITHIFHIKCSSRERTLEQINEHNLLGSCGNILQNGSFVYFDESFVRKQASEKLRVNNLEQEDKLQTILNCFANMSKSTDAHVNLLELGKMVRANIAADRCSVWFIDHGAREYYTLMADGTSQIRVPFGKGIVGAVIDSKQPVLENDPYSNPLFDSTNDARTGYRTKSILAMPIRNSQQQVIGVFQALNKLTNLDGSFSREDFDYVRLAADYSGRIYEGIRFQEEQAQAQKDMIYAISEMVESKSEETGNHVKRVGLVSEVLARTLGYSEEDVKLIGIGAPTHDIGKIGVPDAILNKPARLTEEEFKIMQKHSQIGYDMLRRFKGKIMETAAAIAHEHHEKYGGGGYPRGIKGEAIHPFARIVAVADVFDALASDRCYKKAWPLSEVEDFFRANSGSHFDPKVVDAFFASREEIYRINRELADVFPDKPAS